MKVAPDVISDENMMDDKMLSAFLHFIIEYVYSFMFIIVSFIVVVCLFTSSYIYAVVAVAAFALLFYSKETVQAWLKRKLELLNNRDTQ